MSFKTEIKIEIKDFINNFKSTNESFQIKNEDLKLVIIEALDSLYAISNEDMKEIEEVLTEILD